MKNYQSKAIQNEVLEMQLNEIEIVNELTNVKKTQVVKEVRTFNSFAILSIALIFSLTAGCLVLNHFHLINNSNTY